MICPACGSPATALFTSVSCERAGCRYGPPAPRGYRFVGRALEYEPDFLELISASGNAIRLRSIEQIQEWAAAVGLDPGMLAGFPQVYLLTSGHLEYLSGGLGVAFEWYCPEGGDRIGFRPVRPEEP